MISGWASNSHGPRRSHEQSHDLKHSRSSSPDEGGEPPRRSSSDATPRQTPASSRFISATNAASNEQDTNKSVLPSEIFSSSKRLGFFTDKLTSSLSGSGSQKAPSQLLHPTHSHSRTDTAAAAPSSSPSNLTGSSSSGMANAAKSHTSPSKVSVPPTRVALIMVFY